MRSLTQTQMRRLRAQVQRLELLWDENISSYHAELKKLANEYSIDPDQLEDLTPDDLLGIFEIENK